MSAQLYATLCQLYAILPELKNKVAVCREEIGFLGDWGYLFPNVFRKLREKREKKEKQTEKRKKEGKIGRKKEKEQERML